MGEDGPVLAVLGAELPPFKALTNPSSGVGRIKDRRHPQTVKEARRGDTCTHSKELKLQNLVTFGKDKNIQKNVLTNASFWCDVSWWTSLTRRRVGRPIRN